MFEGEGRVAEYVGGYSDWARQRPSTVQKSGDPSVVRGRKSHETTVDSRSPSDAKKRLSYHEQRELVDMPVRIEALEAEAERLNGMVSEPGFYRETRETIESTLASLDQTRSELDHAYSRWEVLEERRGNFRG